MLVQTEKASSIQMSAAERFELRYDSIYAEGRALAFPCNRSGRVDPDELPDRARLNYFFARAMVGREFYAPKVAPRLS